MDDVIGSDSSSDIFMEDARELPANHRLAPRQYICYRRYRHRQRCHHQEQGGRHDSHYYRRAAITIPEPILSGASVLSCLTKSSPMLINRDNCREKVMKFYETCRHILRGEVLETASFPSNKHDVPRRCATSLIIPG